MIIISVRLRVNWSLKFNKIPLDCTISEDYNIIQIDYIFMKKDIDLPGWIFLNKISINHTYEINRKIKVMLLSRLITT